MSIKKGQYWIYVGNDNDWKDKKSQEKTPTEMLVSPGQGHTTSFKIKEIKSIEHMGKTDIDDDTVEFNHYEMKLAERGKSKYNFEVPTQFEERVREWWISHQEKKADTPKKKKKETTATPDDGGKKEKAVVTPKKKKHQDDAEEMDTASTKKKQKKDVDTTTTENNDNNGVKKIKQKKQKLSEE